MTREKFIFLLLFAAIFIKVSAQTTPVPDTNFEQFLVDQGLDTNGLTGNILNTDAQSITNLNVTRTDITDFTGLEAFVNLVTLNAGTNQFLTLPLNALVLLEELRFRDNQALASLDLSSNAALRVFEIRAKSSLPIPTIPSIDLSQNTNLEKINIATFASITTLTLPVTPTLVDIDLASLSVPVIDLSLLTGDIDFKLVGSKVNVNIVYPNKVEAMKRLELSSIVFPILDLSELIGLERLSLFGSNVESLTLPNTNNLTVITIWNHKINAPLSMSVVPQLEALDIRSNFGTVPLDIDLSSNLELTSLNLTNDLMNVIDVTQNTKLTTFRVYTNNLTTLDVTQNLVLDRLEAYQNQLPSIDLSQNTVLQWLNLSNNQLPSLNITNNIDLQSVNISANLFTGTGLDLTQNISLRTLNAAFNQIESLDITQNVALGSLTINDNLFTGTDIIDQFYEHYQNRPSMRVNLNVENNMLSGRIPDFFSVFPIELQTRRNGLKFSGNAFEFGDFENEHLDYISLLSTMTIGPSPDFIFRDYAYAPQAKVNAIENPVRNAGESITLLTEVSGTQNHYKWFKDGVEIPDAPDAPELVLTNLNTCDAGLYHAEITSDLVPFENANPPGTNGRNLLLVRNDITLTVNATKECVGLVQPANGATNIPINTGIEWVDTPGACGYKISVGTTTGGTDVVNDEDVGEVTVYNFTSNLAPNQQYFVTIVPYYDDGDFTGCTEQSFTTNATAVVPSCTQLLSPTNGAIDIRNDLPDISWNPANGADEYRVSVTGSLSTSNNITDQIITGNSYNFSNNFDNGETVTVTIIPRNSIGDAVGCTSESFTIVSATPTIPNCTNLDSPANNATDIAVDTNISWNAVSDATGYRISISSTSGNNNITDFDNGNNTSYNPPINFDNDDLVNVTITPYNGNGSATGCTAESFTIVAATPTIPNCTNLDSPANSATDIAVDTNISWNTVSDATGYRISISSTSGNNNITNFDNGNNTSYNPPINFDNDDVVNVTITPYNGAGSATGCTAESFTIVAATPTIPNCTNLDSPANNATDIAVDTNISWNAVSDATGYRISISSTSGNNNITDFDNGNNTSYNPPINFDNDDLVNVTITPYNGDGSATGCTAESFTIVAATPTIPNCTNLDSPANSATDIAVDTNISWNTVSDATGYRISISSTSGNNNITDFDNGNNTSYNPPINFDNDDVVNVTITPYNGAGSATGCTAESFTIVAATPTIPNCTNLDSPANSATDIAVDTNISWNAISDATGYRISISSTSGNNNITDFDNGNNTSYNPPINFDNDDLVNVTITPYNGAGSATGCTAESFTIVAATPTIPNCTNLDSPANSATDIAVDTNISWNAISDATGYRISISSTSGNNNITDFDNGNNTSYNPPINFDNDDLVNVTITPYNVTGNATGCTAESFTIVAATPTIPNCTNLDSPANNATDIAVDTNISWNTVSDATGYRISISSTSGNNNITDFDNGNNTSYNPPINFDNDDLVNVTITPYNVTGNATGCTAESFRTEEEIIPEDDTKYGFSPNGDGIRDVWKIMNIENYPNNRVTIYNRWGNVVFQISGYDNVSRVFNGTANKLTGFGAGELPSGTYFFNIEIQGSHNLKKLKGFIALKR